MRVPLLLLAVAGAASAQSLTPEEIDALVDQELAKEDPYEAMLNQDDPERALATMRVMLNSGDPELVRMATEFGIYSPNPEVQREALRGFLMSEPRLEVRLNIADADAANYEKELRNFLGTVPDAEGEALWSVQITGHDPEQDCFTIERSRGYLSPCLVRIGPRGVMVNAHNSWSEAQIAPDGWLTATVSFERAEDVGMRILVAP